MTFLVPSSESVECTIFAGDFKNSTVFCEVFDGFDTTFFSLSCVDNWKNTNHAVEFLSIILVCFWDADVDGLIWEDNPAVDREDIKLHFLHCLLSWVSVCLCLRELQL